MRPIIGTSWKMNLTSTETARYCDTLRPLVADITDRDLFVLPPFTSISMARERLRGSRVAWGGQDVHEDDSGAHTGDISAPMLADLDCVYAEVGHSERREDHGETDEIVAAKVMAAQRWRMTAIVCVGERDRVRLPDAIAEIALQLGGLASADAGRLVIAYEPVWAIGVGSAPAEPAWVGEVHEAIHDLLSTGVRGGSDVRVIYGGSVDADSAEGILAQPGVDGLFVGRSALDPVEFARIAHAPLPARLEDGARRRP
ncbi:MAG: triose-phosphate isomerase [Candidatus Limnocylindrales bacterium]